MICYYYPPITDVGSKRSSAFAKYLVKFGWHPYVLTVKNPDRGYCSVGSDVGPVGVSVAYSYSIANLSIFVGRLNGILTRFLKLFGIELKRNYVYDLFCIPDYFWGWIPLTVLKAYKLIKTTNIDLVYVSCSPYSSALVGLIVKKLTGKSLIVDYRDPMAIMEVFELFSTPRLRRVVNRFLESKIIATANVFIVNTEETRKAYVSQYNNIKEKIFTVHNGFDSNNIVLTNSIKKYKKFTIIYTGEFYFYGIKSKVFFESLSLLKRTGKISQQDFQFLFFGEGNDLIKKIAEDFDITDLVRSEARIPYMDVLKTIKSSHLQLLRILKPMISTKLYEGIPLNVPFLATIPQGEAEDIIKQYSPSSFVITEDSPKAVNDAILDSMAKYRNNEIKDNYVHEFLNDFSREKLTLKLINIIEQNLFDQGVTIENS